MKPALVLASTSPRRRHLLERMGIAFEAVAPDPSVELEVDLSGATLTEIPERLARAKAHDVAARRPPESLIVAADTVVVAGARVMGKPTDAAEATRMLESLSGTDHRVMTAVCVTQRGREQTAVEVTRVWFCPLSTLEIQAYVKSGEPFDKAGGYGIQGLGSLLVERLEGCYFNVVGLPLVCLNRVLRSFGVDLLLDVPPEP